MLLPLRTMHLSRSLPLAAIFALTLWLFAQADGPNPPADDTATPAAETPTTEATAQLDAVELERQVRPLLSDTCFLCHGFDSTSRVTGMRLDTAEGPFEDLAGYQAVVPGDREMSELWRRINSDDDFERMPPVDSGRQLTPEQIELIGQWIDAGAPWHGHWAFLPPERAGLPSVDNAVWCNNEIDRFILAELEQHGLAPSPEADRATLIRRVTLDLTGLPPTLEEIDAFLADDSPDAYEQLVDRLLASPRYGEFMAIPWLDAARYSDTLGYQADLTADMWPWRDGLIDALNTNQPFDQFTLEQLAGDMLPGATLEQQIASAFNRLHMTNNEGGAIPEESRVEYVINRLETTGATWLGMTVGCSRCHDHKYDPLTQREFYQLTGYFNNVEETGRVDGPITGTAAPTMGVPSDDQRLELAQLEAEFAILERQLTSPPAEFAAEQAAWEAEQALDSPWQVLAPQSFESTGGATLTALEDDSLLASGEDPPFDTYHVSVLAQPGTITALRLEALPHESLPQGNTGRNAGGNFVLNQFTVEVAPTDAAAQPVAFARAAADYSQNGHDPAVSHHAAAQQARLGRRWARRRASRSPQGDLPTRRAARTPRTHAVADNAHARLELGAPQYRPLPSGRHRHERTATATRHSRRCPRRTRHAPRRARCRRRAACNQLRLAAHARQRTATAGAGRGCRATGRNQSQHARRAHDYARARGAPAHVRSAQRHIR